LPILVVSKNIQILKMLNKKKILFLSPYPVNTAPGQRLKYEQYFEHFKNAGYDVTVSPFITIGFWNIVYKKGFLIQKVGWTLYGYFTRIKNLFTLHKYDAVYVFLWATPFGFPIIEALICKLNKNIIYDIDDMVFLGHSSSANKFMERFKGTDKMIYFMKHAKHVVVCTPKLFDFVSQYNSNVTDISSTINTETYHIANAYNNNKKLVLGWSGSHSTSKYLLLLEPVLQRLKHEFDFEIKVIGDPHFKFNELAASAIAWNATTEVQDLQHIDIGLYPLPNEEWVYGKSGLKALQYMALGVPTVATAIGANYRVIEHEKSGYLASNETEWYNAIKLLINNPQLRQKIGFEARERVVNQYSILANKQTYISILDNVTAL
jgi:L-malate glycosyltransferase